MGHGHDHVHSDYNRAFAIGVGLNLLFVAIEGGYGFFAHSLALLADAGHNLSDVVSLLLAWGANTMVAMPATEKRTYGFRKVSIMASLVSAVLLVATMGGITWEAIKRLMTPHPVEGNVVIVVAAIGVVINSITAMLFFSGQKHDLNIKGAFLHMAADAAVSLGVVIAGIFIVWKGWLWIDPAISLLVVTVILIGTWGLFRDSLNLAIDAVPGNIDLAGIKEYLAALEPVTGFHDLHVWAMSTTQVALTVHIIVDKTECDNRLLQEIHDVLHDRFKVEHTTIQVEIPGEDGCVFPGHVCG